MSRQTFDQQKIAKTVFNQSITFYVQCDCGELAKTVYGKHYFECDQWKRRYVQQFGDYVEMKGKDSSL